MTTATKARVWVAILVVVVAGAVFFGMAHGPGKPHFCQPSLPVEMVHGKSMAHETKGSDGGTCPVPKTNPGMETVGLDCKIRDPNGKVVATVKPKHEGGVC